MGSKETREWGWAEASRGGEGYRGDPDRGPKECRRSRNPAPDANAELRPTLRGPQEQQEQRKGPVLDVINNDHTNTVEATSPVLMRQAHCSFPSIEERN